MFLRIKTWGRLPTRYAYPRNIPETPLENMIINVGIGLVVVPLKFGTYFGACFRCNKFGHFAKSCPSLVKPRSQQDDVNSKVIEGFGGVEEEGLVSSAIGTPKLLPIDPFFKNPGQDSKKAGSDNSKESLKVTQPKRDFEFLTPQAKKKLTIVQKVFLALPLGKVTELG